MDRTSVHEHAHSKVLTPDGIDRSLRRISHEILERNASNLDNLALVGVLTRGVPLARRISENIRLFEGLDVPVGSLDITLHRDDLAGEEPEMRGSRVPFEVTARTVVLVDDVLYTGRTVRAALDEFADFGRPRRILLCVLIDRGRRELPIQADIVGTSISSGPKDRVDVFVSELDGRDAVELVRGS